MVKYFALIDPPWGDLATATIVGLFREIDESGNHSLELFTKDGTWVHDEYGLARYIFQGEPVSEEQAEAIIARLGGQKLND